MNRRQFLLRSSLFAAGLALPARQMLAQIQGQFTEIRRNVGYFTERGGTIGWLASPGGMAVVDSQFPETARNCLNGLKDRTNHPLDLLLNTHHHGDHTAGNTVFEEVAKQMVAHENVPGLMKKAAEESDGNSEPAYPSDTFTVEWNAEIGDEIVHAKHYGAAHTGGDAVIYFEKANVVHMGDLVFNRMNPYTDHPSGASIINWIKVLKSVEDEFPADARYIFGHAKPEAEVTGSKEDVAVMRTYLTSMVEYVEESIEKGMSREAIVSKEELDGFEDFLYADFWTLPDNLKVVYTELSS